MAGLYHVWLDRKCSEDQRLKSGDADSLYDTSWTVYDAPETVTTGMAQTSDFVIKMSARGSESWSNTVTFKVIPPDEDREYRWPSLVVISKAEE